MNAKDLMIGDWVQVVDASTNQSIPCRITRICESGYVALDGEIDAADMPTDLLMPIPLTPEILEKNGFEQEKNYPNWLIADIEGFHFSIYQNPDSHKLGSPTINKGQLPIMNNITFRFAHELQHALRLCGIEKEIVL